MPPQINEDFTCRQLPTRYAPWVCAPTPTTADASKARELGAEGIGLCRTEHMFMAQDRLPAVRKMILAQNSEERAAALAEILPMQQVDFEGIFTAMKGLPVTVRLLDPPLHEFLPNLTEQSLKVQALELTGGDAAQLAAERKTLSEVRALHEQNPMLGTRGCRLGHALPRDPGHAGSRHRPRRSGRAGARG